MTLFLYVFFPLVFISYSLKCDFSKFRFFLINFFFCEFESNNLLLYTFKDHQLTFLSPKCHKTLCDIRIISLKIGHVLNNLFVKNQIFENFTIYHDFNLALKPNFCLVLNLFAYDASAKNFFYLFSA